MPIQEVLHCPLAFAGVHLLKDLPEHAQVAYHYCKPVNDDLSQCVLYDGTGPDARLIGIEYLVSDAVYQKMPTEEKAFWHDHKYEVDSGLLKSLTQTGPEEKKTLAAVRTLWGKVFHTWATGKSYPSGPPAAVLGSYRRGAVRALVECKAPRRVGQTADDEVGTVGWRSSPPGCPRHHRSVRDLGTRPQRPNDPSLGRTGTCGGSSGGGDPSETHSENWAWS